MIQLTSLQPENRENKIPNAFSETQTPRAKIKINVLAVVSIALAVGFSWILKLSINGDGIKNPVLSVALASLFLIFFLLQSFFIKEDEISTAIIFFQSIGLISFFASFSLTPLILFVFVFGILYEANKGGRKLVENSLEIDFWNVSRIVLSRSLIAMFLIPSVFVPLGLSSQNKFPISIPIFEQIISSSNSFISAIIPGMDTTASLEKTSKKLAEERLKEITMSNELNTKQKEVIINKSADGLYGQLAKFFGIKIDPQLKISQVIYQGAKAKFDSATEQVKSLVFVIIGAIIFLFLTSVIFPIRIILAVISRVFFEIFIAAGFARIENENKLKEVVVVD